VVFDYVDGGAEDERTMKANTDAFAALTFRPHMGTGTTDPSTSVRLFGENLSIPVILAPCGLVRLVHPDGGIGAAGAASSQGTISVLSTVAGAQLEEVAASTSAPMWFQLYAADRSVAGDLVERAATAGYKAIVVTVDTPVLGRREREIRNGVQPPLRINPAGAVRLGPQILMKPGWAWRMARSGLRLESLGGGRRSLISTTSILSPFRWSDIEWIREQWSGPLLVKGLLTADDAKRAVACGADAVIVSNHGGRQLEGAPATLRALPEVADAVGDTAEVLMVGGVRRGSDVIKAIALGARAVLIGRPYLYGLATGGQGGVEQVLRILRDEMSRTLSLMGCRDVADLDPSWIEKPGWR
jgi:isopentenyl diphosphate isomerase/L-lactate dehydrogenase-like FMN-dependent dehydrogenase